MSDVAVALRSYLTPMLAARPLRVAFLVLIGFLLLVGLAWVAARSGFLITREALGSLREFAVVPGVPLAALLLGELPLRDAIRQRTLLYPLLGPCPRPVLAATRTVATAGLLGAGAAAAVLVVRLLEGGSLATYPAEMAACFLGAAAYVGIFGLVHLVTTRGLIAGLAGYVLLDESLGRLPFSLRNVSPSYHLRVLTDRTIEFPLPVTLQTPESSFLLSSVVLVGIFAVLTAATAWLFSRRSLGELC